MSGFMDRLSEEQAGMLGGGLLALTIVIYYIGHMHLGFEGTILFYIFLIVAMFAASGTFFVLPKLRICPKNLKPAVSGAIGSFLLVLVVIVVMNLYQTIAESGSGQVFMDIVKMVFGILMGILVFMGIMLLLYSVFKKGFEMDMAEDEDMDLMEELDKL
jgi:hypothetical protein